MKWLAGLAVLLVLAANPVYAQEVEPDIFTDRGSYIAGDEVTISGNVGVVTGEPAIIQVFNPKGSAYRFDLVYPATDGSFTYALNVGGPLAITGTYEVRAHYGGNALTTSFEFDGLDAPLQQTVQIGDTIFTIPYRIYGGTLESIDGSERTATLTAMINAESDGKLLLYLPGSFLTFFNLDDGSGMLLDPIIFVDEIEEFPEMNIYDCHVTIEIPFSAGSEQIDIVGTFLASTSYGVKSKGNSVEAVISAEHRQFTLDIITNADTCHFSFDQENRRFRADITGQISQGYFQVTLPHEFLGGPYTVLVDSEQVEFEGVFSNATGRHTTTISVQYDGVNARTIDIVGTTAIPEFGFIAVAVAALSVASAIAATRLKYQ